MRKRLRLTLISLMAGVVLALAMPLAGSIADVRQQRMLADRLADAQRMASVAAQATTVVDQRVLSADIRQYDQVHGVFVGVFDRQGELIAASRESVRVGDDAAARLTTALGGHSSSTASRIWPWHVRDLIVAEPLVREGDVIGALVSVSPTDDLRASVGRMMAILALGVIAVLAGCAAVASRVTGWVIRPVRLLDRAAQEIGSGRLGSRIAEESGPPELRRLTHSFNDMAARVEEASERQRAFVADASHQLRNPLHALLLRIDQLEEALLPGHDGVHRAVRAEAKRLARILDELLRLARLEGGRASSQPVDVNEIVTDRVRTWSLVGDTREITLLVTPIALRAPVLAWSEPTALGTAMDAVLDNALKYSPPGSTVEVALRDDEATVSVVISDEGPGLAPDELQRVTDRFWRSPQHQNVSGTGLGLSIAQSLLRRHAARIEVSPRQPTGLSIALVLPAASPGVTA